MDFEEERDPCNDFFTEIDFLTQPSSSSSTFSFDQLDLEERYCTMSRQEAARDEKGANEEAIDTGMRRVFNPYAMGYQNFPSGGSTPITPSAAKKRRVQTPPPPPVHISQRDVAVPSVSWNLNGSHGNALMETLSQKLEEQSDSETKELEKNTDYGMDAQGLTQVSNSHAEQIVIDPFVTASDIVVVEEEAQDGANEDIILHEGVNWCTPEESAGNQPVVIEKDQNVDIDMLARCIVKGTDGAVFEDGEREEIGELTSNSKRYCERQSSMSRKFLTTAADRCGEDIKHMATAFHEYKNGTSVPLLYYVLSGEKAPSKKIILNSIMVQCALSWRLERAHRDKKKGDFPESTTWDQWLKLLQGVFAKNLIKYHLKTEFFGKGEFHAVLEKFYRQEKKKNPKFGTGQYASFIPEDLEEKLLLAIEENKLDLEERWHLQLVCYYLIGARLLIRGGTEGMDRCWSEFDFVKVDEMHGQQVVQVNYIKLVISQTVAKNMQITVRGMFLCVVLFLSFYYTD